MTVMSTSLSLWSEHQRCKERGTLNDRTAQRDSIEHDDYSRASEGRVEKPQISNQDHWLCTDQARLVEHSMEIWSGVSARVCAHGQSTWAMRLSWEYYQIKAIWRASWARMILRLIVEYFTPIASLHCLIFFCFLPPSLLSWPFQIKVNIRQRMFVPEGTLTSRNKQAQTKLTTQEKEKYRRRRRSWQDRAI